MNCSICGALSTGGQYCVGCGEPLGSTLTAQRTAISTRERARPAPGTWLALQEIRLVACPKCGAPNSAARWRCARCGEGFGEHDNSDSITGETTSSTGEVAAQPESARWLALITAAAGVAVIAVAIMILAARGVGPFRSEDQATALAEAIAIPVAHVEASSPGIEGGSVGNLVDGDETTSWRVAGTGRDEWIELRFGEPVQIDYLLVSNGDQRNDSTFAAASRIKDLLIEFPNARKAYRVGLPDSFDSVRITTKTRPPVTDVIRLKILDVHEGQTSIAALSEIEALSQRGPVPE
jgi:hypothetical protein